MIGGVGTLQGMTVVGGRTHGVGQVLTSPSRAPRKNMEMHSSFFTRRFVHFDSISRVGTSASSRLTSERHVSVVDQACTVHAQQFRTSLRWYYAI